MNSINRRELLIQTASLFAGMLASSRIRAQPCMPPSVSVAGGSKTNSQCGYTGAPGAYSLPEPGHAIAISRNFPSDVRPASHTKSQWAYSLFSSYGSGVYVSSFSSHGAYVLAGTGGHNHSANVDAVIFDFSDATWKRVPNANGVAPRSADYSVTETSGAPYLEITGSEVPSPPHPYRNLVAIPTEFGGGESGSVAYFGRAAVCKEALGTEAIHRFNLATAKWSRWTDDRFGGVSGVESDAVLDDQTGRVYGLANNSQYQSSLSIFDCQTGTIASVPMRPWKFGTGYPSAFIHPNLRLIIQHRKDTMCAMHLDSPGAMQLLNVAGLADSLAGQVGQSSNAFCYFPPTGNFYWLPKAGGNTLTRLRPPTSSPLTSEWTVDSTDIEIDGGGALPPHGNEAISQAHYRSLFYVARLQCLAWAPGESTSGATRPVFLLRPAA